MKKIELQDGSAHVVLIVLLILIILGGIGYVGYHAVTKEKTAPTQSQQSARMTTATRELAFDDWSVVLPVSKSSNLYLKKYVAMTGEEGLDVYDVYDTDFDRVCPTTAPNTTSIGSVTRAKADEQADRYFADQGQTNRQYFTKNPSAAVIEGDYVYYFVKPNGSYACTDPANDNGGAADTALGNAKDTFLGALPKLYMTNK